jgi:hypothetical protein
MATNYNYPDPADIEAQAQYRPGVASNIFNVLTGGLAGAVTGSTQRGQEAARARQALLQEEFNKRDEERAIKKQMMENTLRLKIAAAEGGLGVLPGSNPEEVLAQAMEARKRREIGTEAAQMAALGRTPQGMALLANRQDPAFQSGYGATKRDILGKELEAAVQERIEAPKRRKELLGMDPTAQIPEDATAAQIQGMLNASRYGLGYRIPAQMRQEDDKINLIDMYTQYPGLEAFGGRSDSDIQNLPASAAKAILTRANNEVEKTKTLRNKEAQSNAFTRTIGILNLPFEQRTTPENLQVLYADSALVGKTITDSPKWQAAMGLGPSLSDKELENVRSYSDSLEIGNNFAKLLADVAKQPGGLKKFQNNNFGTIANAVNSKGSKFFSNDAERELARALVQEYEGFRQVPRKTLFGASLTGTEQESANISFGTPSDKDFFNRAVQFIDRVQQTDPVTFYLNSGKSINDPLVSKVISQKKTYSDYRNAFAPSPLTSQEEARKQELLRKTRRTQ